MRSKSESRVKRTCILTIRDRRALMMEVVLDLGLSESGSANLESDCDNVCEEKISLLVRLGLII